MVSSIPVSSVVRETARTRLQHLHCAQFIAIVCKYVMKNFIVLLAFKKSLILPMNAWPTGVLSTIHVKSRRICSVGQGDWVTEIGGGERSPYIQLHITECTNQS